MPRASRAVAPVVGRLAPTPSGRLHLGNALAFGAAWLSVRAQGGRLLLRVEDVDRGRARTDVEASIREDLVWLGLEWDEETPPQRERDYAPWLVALRDRTYACRCSRQQVQFGHAGVYPGTCRDAGLTEGAVRFRLPDGEVDVVDRARGHRRIDPVAAFGDPVLRRRDGTFTYNLAVVADDVADGITEVVRGADLLDFTSVQIRLWEAFEATTPTWLHAPLVLGPDGRKLAKSEGAVGIASLRASGATPRDVWRRLLPLLGLEGFEHVHDAVGRFDPARLERGPVSLG